MSSFLSYFLGWVLESNQASPRHSTFKASLCSAHNRSGTIAETIHLLCDAERRPQRFLPKEIILWMLHSGGSFSFLHSSTVTGPTFSSLVGLQSESHCGVKCSSVEVIMRGGLPLARRASQSCWRYVLGTRSTSQPAWKCRLWPRNLLPAAFDLPLS